VPRKHITRLIRAVNAGHGRVRYDVTIPEGILCDAGVPEGGLVEVRVSARRNYIILMPIRAGWPFECTNDACMRVSRHVNDCVAEPEVLF